MDELELIQRKIYEIRGQRVMLDRDLAGLYKVTTGNLNKAVKRNIRRFPPDFMFQLTKAEFMELKSSLIFQIGISNDKPLPLDGIARTGRGGTRSLPYAFTEQGVAMLSGVLKSEVAIDTNISIMRAFVAVRRALTIIANQRDIEDLRLRIKALEESGSATQAAVEETRKELIQVYEALTELGEKQKEPLPEIGYAAILKRTGEEKQKK